MMLELVQSLLQHSSNLHARDGAECALRAVADEFGFSAGVVLEYGPGLTSISDIVDSDADRRVLWHDVLRPDVVRGCVQLTEALADRATISRFDPSYFAGNKPCLAAAEELQVLEGVAVPIRSTAGLSGVVKFSGAPALSEAGFATLHTAAYLMFGALQSTRPRGHKGVHLTPREKQVMELTALGHTTGETALILGMSERTVNQHTDNVAYKLGTRNRVHTVASLVRLHLM